MRLSTVFELLLIFLFIAFAASRNIDKTNKHGKKQIARQAAPSKPATGANRYCQCASLMCNCCRDFSLPVVSLKGPGCASMTYLNGDSMRLTMSFGDRVLRNITLSGKKPNPVCVGLPGGISKFCGRVYGIQKDGDQFKACLALELRALDDIEAALRVSCFKFGPQGVKLEPSKPIPVTETEDEDDDDDDDDYGLGDDDDDDDDYDAFGLDDDTENDVDSSDYTGFSALSDEFLDGFFGDSSNKKKKKKPTPEKATTAKPQVEKVTKKPVKVTTTVKSISKVTSAMPVETPTTAKSVQSTIEDTAIVSTEMSIKVVQGGNTLDPVTTMPTTVQEIVSEKMETTIAEEPEEIKEQTTVKVIEEKKDTDNNEQEDSDNSEEDDDNEQNEDNSEEESDEKKEEDSEYEDSEENTTEKEDKDDNLLDGLLGDDSDEKEYDESDEEFRQLRSYVPKGNYRSMTPEEQENRFPGLSALIKPSPQFLTNEQQVRMFPGLAALLKPSPTPSYSAFAFPPVRSARRHRRMRLPPLKLPPGFLPE